MDLLKKAKSQAKAAVQDAQGMYNNYKQQQQQQQQQQGYPQAPPQSGYQQPQQGHGAPQTYARPQQNHQAPPHNYQQGQASYQPQAAYGYGHQPAQPSHQQPGHQEPSYQQPGYQHPGYQQSNLGPVQPTSTLAPAPAFAPVPAPVPAPPHNGYSQGQPHGHHQPPPAPSYPQSPPSQHLYQQPGPPTPPAQPFDMNSLHQAFPGSSPGPQPPYSPSSIQSSPPADKPGAPPAAHYSPPGPAPPPAPHSAAPPVNPPATREAVQAARPPAPAATQGNTNPVPPPTAVNCPRHEPALVDMVQFYVLKSHVRSQVEPALEQDEFAVCSACYTTQVARYPSLASDFEARQKNAASPEAPQASFHKLYCDLALSSTRQVFYQQAVPQGSCMPLVQLAKYHITLPMCDGSLRDSPVEYYLSKRGDDFGCCKTCYEWFIRNTPFEREMALEKPDSGWFCDIGRRGYLYRALAAELESQQPDVARFSESSKRRNALPPCNGAGTPIATPGTPGPHFAFEPPSGKAGVVCQSCFWDKILGTSMEPFFNKYTQLEEGSTWPCDLKGIVETFAMKAAIRAGDDEVWRRCITGRHSLPKCMGIEGVDEEYLQGKDPESNKWYCYTEFPSIEICAWCHCAIVEVLGAGHLFSLINRPLRPGIARMCFLSQTSHREADISEPKQFENSLVWRGEVLHRWLHQGYDWHGNFCGLRHVAQYISTLPPPCASNARAIKAATGRKWYGNHFLCEGDETKLGIGVCEECYIECIKDTPLEWFVGCDETEKIRSSHPEGYVCCARDRRARDELRDACEKSDFLQFARFWAKRKEEEEEEAQKAAQSAQNAVNDLTQLSIMQMQYQNHMAGLNLMTQANAYTNATIWRI